MDPAILATQTAKYLVPFLLTETGKAVAKRVGDAATDKAVQLYQFLKTKLTTASASEAFTKLEKTPDDEDRQTLFRLTLKEALVDDADFRDELAALLHALAPEAGAVTQTANVVGNENTVAQVSGTGNTVVLGKR